MKFLNMDYLLIGPVKDIISYLVGADCWDVSITSNNTLDVKMNTYVLFDKIGRCFNQEHENFIPNPQYLEEEKCGRLY